jgi:trigger factor
MESTAENTNPLERRLDLTIARDALESAIESRLKRIGRTLKLPGFRPGKVPFTMVKQQYGAEARHEALQEALQAAFGEALASQNLHMAGYPRIAPKNGASDTHLEFEAVFEVYPEFPIGDLSSADFERPVLEVGDAEIDRTLEILRRQRVRYEAVERGAAKEDRVVVDFLGKKNGVPFQGGEAHDYPFVLGQNMMLPGFEAAIEGLRAGESKVFEMTFPEDYFAKDMAGQTVTFEITVKQVMAPVLPEIDADFARTLGIADGDVAKMRAEVASNLAREVKKRIESRLKDQVMDALLAAHPIPVPNALVELEIERLIENARRDLEQRGMQVKDFPIKPEWFAEQAKRRVTLGLILAELVRKEKLEARPEQVRTMVEEAAETYENPAEVVNWYYSQPQRLAEVEAMVIEENVVEWALAKARVTDKPVDFDTLMDQKKPA